ncbi:MAG: sigma 54-interacting transcriptional regulator [Spirochaetaceae bacterium]|jgi:psp operon transcriptional activator|nr:sigma 54-interacting transcriptional regulator [Spirochaetaceae bacterium]
MKEYSATAKEALGESELFLDFQQHLSRASKVNRPMLIIGERGTGKELAASRLHFLSDRWENPFVTMNCASLPPGLIESELFGHEAGSFTGAAGRRKGRFEEADGGTLFLDEIGLIPMVVQEKILRAVEYGTFERVGSSFTHEVDVRIVAATNDDLPALCKTGKFKEDLLDRLSFEVLFVPPLRVREDDILLLAFHFAARMNRELGRKEDISFSEDVIDKMVTFSWPGNVRQLKNVVERAVYTCTETVITEIKLDPFENPFADKLKEKVITSAVLPVEEYKDAMTKLEIDFVKRALKQSEGKQKNAADLMQLTYDQFRGLYRKYSDELADSDS